jgi:hypothetical protein
MRALIAAERETYRRMIFSTDDSSHASVSAISRMVRPRTLRLEAGVKSKPGSEDSAQRDRLRHHEASAQDQD